MVPGEENMGRGLKGVIVTLTVIVLLLGVVPVQVASASSTQSGASSNGSGQLQDMFLVRPGHSLGGEGQATAASLLYRGMEVVESYDDFVLASLLPAEREALVRDGFDVSTIPERTMTGRGLYFFDTSSGEPYIPKQLKVDRSKDPGYDLYILQFVGPIKQAWLTQVRAMGVEVFDYLPSDSFITAMDQSTLQSVQHQRFVQWVGTYEPGYKISPELLYSPGASQTVTMSILPGRSAGWVAQAVASLGGGLDAMWMEGAEGRLQATIPTSFLWKVAQMREISWIEGAQEYRTFNDNATWVLQSNDQVGHTRPIFGHGLAGQGQLVTMADTGVLYQDAKAPGRGGATYFAHEMFLDPESDPVGANHRKIQEYYIPSGALGDASDFDGHGTHVAGTVLGDAPELINGTNTYGTYNKFDGQAYQARMIVQDIKPAGPGTAVFPPPDFNNMFQPAWANGSMIHTDSWGGGENLYTFAAQSVDAFMSSHQDFLILFAIGNNGPISGTVSSVATPKNIITVGGSGNGNKSNDLVQGIPLGRYFSGRGPAADGRMKPTLMAPGDLICSASILSGPTDTTSPFYCNPRYERRFGTSQATPAVAGSAAIVREYFQEGWYPNGKKGGSPSMNPSAALVKAVLINGAEEMTGADAYGQSSPPTPNKLEASTAQKVSGGFSMHLLKCAGTAVPGCASGDSVTDRYYSRALSPKADQVDYSQNYSLDMQLFLPSGVQEGQLYVLYDGRASITLYPGSPNSRLLVEGLGFTAEAPVTPDQWHQIHIDYNPNKVDPVYGIIGLYSVSLDGVKFAVDSFMNGPPTYHMLVGTPAGVPGPTSSVYYGEFYLDDIRYSSPSGLTYFLDNFDDGDMFGWAVQTGPKPEFKYPNNHQGWGRINLENSLYFDGDKRRIQVFDDKVGFNTGEGISRYVYVADPSQALKVTLVWTDPPGAPDASYELVNNLNLAVEDPLGNVYYGNAFATYSNLADKLANPGQSVTGGSPDLLNVEEGVIRYQPMRGVWRIAVIGASIPMGPQPYALVISQGVADGPAMFSDNFDDGSISDWTLNVGRGNTVAVSTAQSVSAPYSMHVFDAGNQNPARATSKKVDLDYSQEYQLGLRFYLATGTIQKEMLMADDGRAYAKVYQGSQGTTLQVKGANKVVDLPVTTGSWHRFQIIYHPSAGSGGFDAVLDDFTFATSFTFIGQPLKQLSLGTDTTKVTRSGDIYFDNVIYSGAPPPPPVPTTLLSDNFDDCNIQDWYILASGASIVKASNFVSVSPACSLYIKYVGTDLGRASSPLMAGDFTKNYTITFNFLSTTPANKYAVVVDDGRVVILDKGGTFYASTASGDVAIGPLNAWGNWWYIQVQATPANSTYKVTITGYHNYVGYFAFKAASTNNRLSFGSTTKPTKQQLSEDYWDNVQITGIHV